MRMLGHHTPPLRHDDESPYVKHAHGFMGVIDLEAWGGFGRGSALACRTGGLAGPARYLSARTKRKNEHEAPS